MESSYADPCFVALCCDLCPVGSRDKAGICADPEKIQKIVQLRFKLQTELNELRYADAEKTALEMKGLSEETFRGQPLMQAAVLTNVGAVYESLFKLDDAEKVYKQVLEAFEAGGDASVNGVALTLNNLGTLYQKQGRVGESEKSVRRAVDVAQLQVGRERILPGEMSLKSGPAACSRGACS